MRESFKIDGNEMLNTVEDLNRTLSRHEFVEIQYESLPHDYVLKLTYSFPDHAVFNRRWDKTIFLFLEKQHELYQCARSFRHDANSLMKRLSERFALNLETLEGLRELKYLKSDKQRGSLGDSWQYHFHGAECRFENLTTGQIVEVIITTHPEFGYLDSYFFYTYMSTTDRFKELAHHFNDDHLNIDKALGLLVFYKVLTRVESLSIDRNIIAL